MSSRCRSTVQVSCEPSAATGEGVKPQDLRGDGHVPLVLVDETCVLARTASLLGSPLCPAAHFMALASAICAIAFLDGVVPLLRLACLGDKIFGVPPVSSCNTVMS